MKTWAVIVKNILLHVFIMYHGLKNSLWRSVYFFLFLAVSFFYFLHPCGAVFLHPDTILRKRGVHQLLKCLVVVKARKPRLKQSHLCSCHLVRHQFLFYPQEMLQTPTFGSCQSSWLYLFTSLLCRLALHLTSWAV